MTDSKIITQLSIFVNNEPGRLANIASIMKECSVNMKAFNLAESTEFGILRAIVDNPEDAYDRLKSRGIIAKKTDVIGVVIDDTPGSVIAAADAFGANGINIDYGYAYTGKTTAAFFIRVDDPQKAVGVLEKAGIRLITYEEI